MKKFVFKTALKTFFIVVGVLVIGFLVFNLACPQHMATLFEQAGNYNLAVRYAALRYSYTDDTNDLARCLEDAILAGDDALTLEYGDEFLERDDSAQVMYELTAERGTDYLQLFGNAVVRAHYSTGDFVGALTLAFNINGETSFAYGNPLMSLAVAVISRSDVENAPIMLNALEHIATEDETEQSYLNDVISRVGSLVSENNNTAVYAAIKLTKDV